MADHQTTLSDYEPDTVSLDDVPAEHLDVGEFLETIEEHTVGEVRMDAEAWDSLQPEYRLQAIALRLEALKTELELEARTDDAPTRGFW